MEKNIGVSMVTDIQITKGDGVHFLDLICLHPGMSTANVVASIVITEDHLERLISTLQKHKKRNLGNK